MNTALQTDVTAPYLDEVSFTTAEKWIFKASDNLTVSRHADLYREVTRGPWQGPWVTDNTPYTKFPMDLFTLPWVRRIYLCWAPQTGKTQVAFNCLNWLIDQDPDTAFYVMSSETTLKRIVRRQIIPMFKTHRRVSKLLSSRADETSTQYISFKNGMDLLIAWASSVSMLASESARYMFFDEIDKYYPRINLSLGEERTNAYPYTKKILYYTTPEDEDAPITQLIRKEADLLYIYHAVCPRCDHSQRMIFDNIRFPKDVRDPRKIEAKNLARYVCEKCQAEWDDSAKGHAVRVGDWVAYHHDNEWPDGKIYPLAPEDIPARPENIALHLPSWYSPFVLLGNVAGAYLRGLSSPDKLKIFVTQHKATPWKHTVITTSEEKILKAKVKELSPQTVPEAAIALTCGIDVQKRGFWFVVRAWARDYTSWLIHYGFLSYWSEIEDLIFNSEYPKADGSGALRMWRAGLDTGGGKYEEEQSSAEEVYFWIIKNRMRGVAIWGTKGASRPLANKVSIGKTIERSPSGKALPGGIQIISLDTDKLKDIYHFRTEKAAEDEPGPMAAYQHNATGKDYARQIMAEAKKRIKNRVTYVQEHRDNHLLDCEVIAHALADPEWPGGGVHMVLPPQPAAKKEKKQEPENEQSSSWLSGRGYTRPDWLNNR
ncbi:MAG: terminase gpA endonuclease subunit [Thermodesulfobacteriota bacterium]|nr:terminase gpA endonuclease subunit [Thermodesulfobacteriota bacterium]